MSQLSPTWVKEVIRWTSPAWYIFLLVMAFALAYAIILLAFSKDTE